MFAENCLVYGNSDGRKELLFFALRKILEILAKSALEFGRRLVQQVRSDNPPLPLLFRRQTLYKWGEHVYASRVKRWAAVDRRDRWVYRVRLVADTDDSVLVIAAEIFGIMGRYLSEL